MDRKARSRHRHPTILYLAGRRGGVDREVWTAERNRLSLCTGGDPIKVRPSAYSSKRPLLVRGGSLGG